MSNRQCPKCGEEYSDTYRTCPFCEEEAAIKKGRPLRRRSGKRVEKRQRDSSGGAGGVMLLLTGVIILGVVGYVFFGEQVADAMGIRSDPVQVDEDPAADPDPAGPTEDEPAQSAPDSTDQPPDQSVRRGRTRSAGCPAGARRSPDSLPVLLLHCRRGDRPAHHQRRHRRGELVLLQ